MTQVSRRAFLATAASGAAMSGVFKSGMGLAADIKPTLTLISQWYHGGDADSLNALGKYYQSLGGVWKSTAVPGFTTDMMNKLRAEIIAGNPPAVSQLKGPEIATWSEIAPTVDLDPLVKAAKFADVVAPVLAKQQHPHGHWIALPLQIHRVNTMWISKKAMAKVGETQLPKTWVDLEALAKKMQAAGIVPIANGGRTDDDGIKFDVCLSGISPATYKKAIQDLDNAALTGPDMVKAFTRLRQVANWLTPDVGSTDWVDYIGSFIKGEKGILFQGTWAQSFIKSVGFSDADYLVGPAPQDNGTPAFVLNSDSFIFWQVKDPSLQAGQTLFANGLMTKKGQMAFPQVSGGIPARADIDLSGPNWSDGQREQISSLAEAISADTVVLTLSQNMAQTADKTAAMMDVITEYVHDSSITPDAGAKKLADSVAKT